jgi:hypothetical protein
MSRDVVQINETGRRMMPGAITDYFDRIERTDPLCRRSGGKPPRIQRQGFNRVHRRLQRQQAKKDGFHDALDNQNRKVLRSLSDSLSRAFESSANFVG